MKKNQDLPVKKTKRGLLVKLSGISTFFLLLSIVVFSVISFRSVQIVGMETAVTMGKDKLKSDIINFEDRFFSEYGQLRIQNRKLVNENDISLEYNYDLIDKLSSVMEIVATVFVKDGNDYRRISTSIVDNTGKRVVDTYLGSNSPAYSSIQSGINYSGMAVILGNDYLTYYRPIFAANSKEVIGILFIGIEMSKIHHVISHNSANQIIIIISIAISILLALIIVNAISLNVILVKPVKDVTGIIRRLEKGDINMDIEESKSRDEIGVMKNELKHLFDGLKRTANFANDIDKGHFHVEYQALSNNDVLGNALLDMRESLQKARDEHSSRTKEEEERNWGTSGLAKFAEILRSDNDNIQALGYNVISNMVKYLGVNQGGIFVINDSDSNDRFLEMVACYAFDRRKFTQKHIKLGEGLLGACFFEGKPIYLTDIPDEYINITSGLGDANPKALFICPLKVNDDILGVIELASFTPFEEYQREFVEKVSESIASTITSVRINIQTKQLLEQSRLQAEEMLNSEEELRQNMEEMQATQEEMRRREVELHDTLKKAKELQDISEENQHEIKQFNDAILKTCNVVQFTPNAVITDVNENLCKLFNTDRSAFIGKHWSVFAGEKIFNESKKSIEAGKIYEDVQQVNTGGDKTKTIIQRFVPIQSKNGELLRVMMLAFPAETE